MSRRRLFGARALPISRAMHRPSRFLPGLLALVAAASALAAPAAAQPRPPARDEAPRPKTIGKFDDWQAATHVEAGQTVCYALTRAKTSTPALPGRGEVVLTVTHRQSLRDAVAISAGFAYAANAAVTVEAGAATLDFYTAQRSAFARNNAAAISAFQRGSQASARSPGPRGPVVDGFSLKGFSAAYAAINKACPAR